MPEPNKEDIANEWGPTEFTQRSPTTTKIVRVKPKGEMRVSVKASDISKKGKKKEASKEKDPKKEREIVNIAPGISFDFEDFRKGIKKVESADGTLMRNPNTTATGFYGQLYSEIKDLPEMEGVSRDDFEKDTTLQTQIFRKRFYEGIGPGTIGLKNTRDLYRDYGPQIEKMGLKPEDVAAIAYFLGRQGSRNYYGYSVRDGKSLKESIPSIYKNPNKTPTEYVKVAYGYD